MRPDLPVQLQTAIAWVPHLTRSVGSVVTAARTPTDGGRATAAFQTSARDQLSELLADAPTVAAPLAARRPVTAVLPASATRHGVAITVTAIRLRGAAAAGNGCGGASVCRTCHCSTG